MKDPSGWNIQYNLDAHRRYREAGCWLGRTLAQEARRRAEQTPDQQVFLGEERDTSYAVLLSDAEALAASLWSLGLRPGEVISFQLPNWIESVLVDLAACLLGLVCNPIVLIYRDSEVRPILRDCRSRALFVPGRFRNFDYAEMAAGLRLDLPDLDHVITVREDRPGFSSIADLVAAGRGKSVPWPNVHSEHVKMVLYTSGTTGSAKGVLHSHDTMSRVQRVHAQHWGICEGDIILMPSPVGHTTGYSNGIELPFIAGTRTIFMDRWDAGRAVGLVDKYGIAGTVGATPFLQELLDAAEAAGSHLPSLKIFACGGAAVPPGLIRRANDWLAGGRAFRVYGSTEAPLITLGYVAPGTEELGAATDGEIIDYEVKVVDEAGRSLQTGEDGEILARGPSLFLGYSDPRQTAESIDPEGFFRTGDIGHVTADNAIVITDRKKDLIIRGGENISAKEIEDVLHRHPGVAEVAVVAMPHARLGETVCAYIIPRAGAVPTFESIIGFMSEAGLARQKSPERIELIEAFPRTAAGKIRKDVLRRRIAELLRSE